MIPELNGIRTITLANLPTPLEEAPRLAKKIGVDTLYFKRDDLTGLAGGGNKARKLEYDFYEILDGGYDVVITAGGIQSNHARMTAAAARKFGLGVKLVLGGPDFQALKGNLLLDVLFGAEVRYLVDDDSNEQLAAAMEKWAGELTAKGFKPYIIPIGGSTGLGALGYVQAMHELAGQLCGEKVQVVLGVGSCGTFAGTVLGCKMFLPEARVIGISVSRSVDAIKKRTAEVIRESAQLINYNYDAADVTIECYDEYFTEYGVMTNECRKAIFDCANLEGILLDQVYTGKVLAGLTGLVERDIIDRTIPVVFIHTGGMPILFSFEAEFAGQAHITKIRKPL